MAMRRWRIGLVTLGLVLLGLGGLSLVQQVHPSQFPGIALWLIGALIIHDGVIAPVVFLTTVIMRRRAQLVPPVVIAIIQGVLVIGGIVTLIVVLEIIKKAIGTHGPTILPLNYGVNLVVFYVVLLALAAGATVFYVKLIASRQKLLPSSDQD